MDLVSIVLSGAFLLQFGGVVWAAARLSSRVTDLTGDVQSMQQHINGLSRDFGVVTTRLAVLEDRQERGVTR